MQNVPQHLYGTPHHTPAYTPYAASAVSAATVSSIKYNSVFIVWQQVQLLLKTTPLPHQVFGDLTS